MACVPAHLDSLHLLVRGSTTDLSVVCEAWCRYKNLVKGENDTMDQFLNDYEKNIKELKKEGVTLPEVVLAMQLIDSAGLSKQDKQMVLTAVDYSKKEEMYDQMKKALRKFFGDHGMSHKQRIKEESVNVAEEEVYATRGRGDYRGSYSGRGRRWTWTGRGSGRGRGTGRGTGHGTTQDMSSEGQVSGSYTSQSNRGRGSYRGRSNFPKKNPRDADGSYLKCLVCESNMHFKRDCPHAYHNREASAFV